MNPKVSIIILNWNGKDLIRECLNSVTTQNYPNFETIVVDNGSIDNSKEIIKKYKVRLIDNPKNLGFAKANNIGINASKGKYILILNNDTKLDKNFLKELVNVAEKHPEAGMFSSKMIFYDKRDKINSIGLLLYWDGTSKDEGFGKNKNEYNEIREVFGPCGGAAFYSRKMLNDIKMKNDYYDSDFFIYSEDLDLAFRARWKGWKCYYVPKAKLYHKFRATTGKVSNFGLYYGIKNKIFFIVKNYPLRLIIYYFPIIITRQLISSFYYLIKLNPVALKSRIIMLVSIPKMIIKRNTIMRNKKSDYEKIKKWLLPRSIKEALFSKEK